MSWFRRPKRATEEELVAARWKRHNERAREEGCQCGRPGTHVRWYGPSAAWTCEAHVGVNEWTRSGDGPWIPRFPTPDEAVALARWETSGLRAYTDVDKIRKGTS